jgi:BlaI family transcriptional regulator, penicillinase repressor
MDKKSPAPLEIRILQVLWELGSPSTVQEVCSAWRPRKDTPGYTTVLKKLQVMEEKGLISHEREGKAYRYLAAVRKREVEKAKLRELQDDLYAGDRMSLVLGFLDAAKVTDEELAEARRLLEGIKKEKSS